MSSDLAWKRVSDVPAQLGYGCRDAWWAPSGGAGCRSAIPPPISPVPPIGENGETGGGNRHRGGPDLPPMPPPIFPGNAPVPPIRPASFPPVPPIGKLGENWRDEGTWKQVWRRHPKRQFRQLAANGGTGQNWRRHWRPIGGGAGDAGSSATGGPAPKGVTPELSGEVPAGGGIQVADTRRRVQRRRTDTGIRKTATIIRHLIPVCGVTESQVGRGFAHLPDKCCRTPDLCYSLKR